MSLPRPIFAGELYLLTRRTTGRQFLLRPSRKRNQEIEYCLAVAAARHNIRIHAFVVMSNHWHAVASDPEGRMPAFLRDAHTWIAKTTNKALGRWENVWSSQQTSLVRSEGDENVLERIVYTMANPVEAGLVAHGKNWPGLRACWPSQRPPVERPRLFRDGGPMPKTATLELHRPPGFRGIDTRKLHEKIVNAIEQREAAKREALRKEGRRALGARAIRKTSPKDSPTSFAPRRQISPRVAEVDKWRRIEALGRLRWFVDAYRTAYQLWRAGFRDVVFPAGTYALRVHASVVCATH